MVNNLIFPNTIKLDTRESTVSRLPWYELFFVVEADCRTERKLQTMWLFAALLHEPDSQHGNI